jgi:hypothetical protein
MAGANTQDIKKVTDSNNAVSTSSKFWFKAIRAAAMGLYYLQRPYTYYKLRNKNKAWTGPLLRHPDLENSKFSKDEILLLPSYLFVKVKDLMERIDWMFFKRRHNGSEMYLIFKK